MQKYKNKILYAVIFLSQAHVPFRDSGIKLEWILNGKEKRLNFAVFLFFVHFRFLIYSYIMMKPKGVSKDIFLFFWIVSIFDMLHFIFLSGYGYGIVKIALSIIVFLIAKKRLGYGKTSF